MKSTFSRWTISLTLAVATVLCAAGSAFAQDGGGQPQQPQQQQPQPRRDFGGQQQGGGFGGQQQGGRGGGQQMDWQRMLQRLPNSQPASIFATNEFIYIVRGNTLYQYDVKTLKQVRKVTFEEELPVAAPAAQGGQGGQQAPPPQP